MAELLSIGLYTLIVAYTGVGNLRVWAERRLLALPNERSSHTQPTPSGGGVAIVLSSLLGILLFALLAHLLTFSLWCYIGGAALIALISWYDDRFTIANRIRFGVHMLGAILFLSNVDIVSQIELPLLGEVTLSWLGILISFLWLVGLTNAYNFMDGIDGLAGSQAVIAGSSWALIGYWLNQPLIMGIGLLLAASSLGFLSYNWPPARIFMGDVGSAFLGYSFASLTLLGTQVHHRLAVVGILIFWPFIFDTLTTIVRRWQRGENIFQAHRSHLYQRLIITGYSHRTVTLLYSFLCLIGAVIGIAWLQNVPGSALVIVILTPIAALGLWWFVNSREHAGKKITPLVGASSSRSIS